MKKTITTLISVLFFVIVSLAQFTGLTGHDNADVTNIKKLQNNIKIYNITEDWGTIETAENVWNWSTFDVQMLNCKTYNLKAEFMVYTGYSAPAYLYQHGVAKVTTNSTAFPYYPDYKSTYYKARFKNMLLQVRNHIAASSYLENVIEWNSAEGATGDEDPTKGEATNPAYAITDEQWKVWKFEVWLYMDSLLQTIPGRPIHLMVNPSNDGENFAWATQRLYEVWVKLGNFGHNVYFPGCWYSAKRLLSLDTTSKKDKNLSRSEFQQIYKQPFWQHYPKAMTWRMTMNALNGGLKQINITAANLSQNTNDLSVYDEFNEFAMLRKPEEADRAVIVFGNPVNLTDTVEYDKLTYGNLVAAGDMSAFNTRYHNQITLNTIDSIEKIENIYTGIIVDFINPVRITAIRASLGNVPKYTALNMGNDNDTWGNDCNIFGVTNNVKFITQSNYVQSKMLFKVGMSALSKFGLYARTFDAANHVIYLNINDAMPLTGGITVEVTYLDTTSTGKWRLDYGNGKVKRSAVVACTGTNTWLKATFTIPDFVGNGLTTDDDLALEYVRGNKTPFQMVKVYRILKP